MNPIQLPRILPASLLSKLAGHAEDRLHERSHMPAETIKGLRSRIRSAKIPPGTHHVVLPDGSYAVIKDVSKPEGKSRHVVATVLASHMRPPGYDLSTEIYSVTPHAVQKFRFDEGPGQSRRSKSHKTEHHGPNSYAYSSGRTTSEVKVASLHDQILDRETCDEQD